uniref:Uncharacterized protein n=1 Tax=Lactuca sativa TaxID=4236 RepID=A0A9R1WK62_LACSA|nr:hypothetical protein LSAT_V11C100033290 [Lactuca sativa]
MNFNHQLLYLIIGVPLEHCFLYSKILIIFIKTVKKDGFWGAFRNEDDRDYDLSTGDKDENHFLKKSKYELQDGFYSFFDQLSDRIKFFRKSKHPPVELHNKEDKNKKINWCSYMIECLVKTKQSFAPSNATSNFKGPSAYLLLLFVDTVKFELIKAERKHPVIRHWTTNKMKMIETYEKKELGDYGTGKLNEEFIEEELSEEGCKEMLMTKFKNLQMLSDKGVDKFPKNVTINLLKNSLEDIFDDDDEDGGENVMEGEKNEEENQDEGGEGGENAARVENEEENKVKGGKGGNNVTRGEENEA